MSKLYIVKCKALYRIAEGKPQKTRKGSIMARYENTLTTLQVRTIATAIEKAANNCEYVLDNADLLEKIAVATIETLYEMFPDDFSVDVKTRAIACALAMIAKIAIQKNELPVAEYIGILAEKKEENETVISDFGAFGDLYEVLVRCALVRVKNFYRVTALYVKPQNEVDIISKKYGKIEVGHNGKSLTHGTLFDFMQGDYTSVIYGVFSDEDKKTVYEYCRRLEFEKAIAYVCEYSVYWSNKYDFQKDMDNLTRGKGITKKGGNIQVVYNPGKYNAFVMAIENGIFKSLTETLKED